MVSSAHSLGMICALMQRRFAALRCALLAVARNDSCRSLPREVFNLRLPQLQHANPSSSAFASFRSRVYRNKQFARLLHLALVAPERRARLMEARSS